MLMRWIFIAMICSLFSCDMHTTIELDIPAPKTKLVANCLFSVDSVWNVHVFKSANVLAVTNRMADRITDATVVVLDGTKEIPLTYNEKLRVYRSSPNDQRAAVGRTYTLKVSAPGYETITSNVAVPEAVPVLGVKSTSVLEPLNEDLSIRTFEIKFKDPPAGANYYALSILISRSWSKFPYRSHGNLEMNPLNPTFSDAYLGEWFTTSLVPGQQDYNLMFNDHTFNGQECSFKFWSYEYKIEEHLTYTILLKSLSEEFYDYRMTYHMQVISKDDPFAQPVQVFSNIHNGYGIFAGYSQAKMEHFIQ
jgi:hypothetical protein